jgi:cell division septation protein DedD
VVAVEPSNSGTSKIEPQPATTSSTPQPSSSSNTGPYRIIVGAFRSSSNAAAFAGEFERAGYPAEVRPQPNGLHMVVLSRHGSKMEAAAALKAFISGTGHSGYISKIK